MVETYVSLSIYHRYWLSLSLSLLLPLPTVVVLFFATL
jgi:hypothetical protein